MVKEITIKDKRIYECENCKLLYKNKKWAEKCELWCNENNSCNIRITKHSIKKTLGGLNEKIGNFLPFKNRKFSK